MTFKYLYTFEKTARGLFSEDDLLAIEVALLLKPEAGALIPGCHGLRKLRWAAKGHGKSGGARIIYYLARRDGIIMLMLAYPKNEQSDITPDQARFLLQILKQEFP
jgi:hypothetical protein